MTCSPLDLTVILAYLFGMRCFGVYFNSPRRSAERSLEDYLFAGRKLSGWVAGLSLVGTSISSITFLAYPADAFKSNWFRLLPSLALPLAILIMARWWLRTLRGSRRVTAYEVLEQSYGSSIRTYGAVAFVIAQLVRMSLILYLIALVAQRLVGLDAHWCILLAGILVSSYTVRGGLAAVVWTDVVQVMMLTLGGALCLWFTIDLTPGGIKSLIHHATQAHKVSVHPSPASDLPLISGDWSLSLTHKTSLMMLAVGLTHWLTEYMSHQSTLQRLYATQSLKEARKALWVTVGLCVPLWVLFMTLGTALYGFFKERPDMISQQIIRGELPAETLIPHFVTQYLPSGVSGLVIAAALAAAMSSLDSGVNAIASVVTHDLYLRTPPPLPLCERRESRGELLRGSVLFARRVSIATMGSVTLGALLFLKMPGETLQDTLITLSALLSGGLLTLYLLALSKLKLSVRDAWVGLSAAGLTTLWFIAASRSLVVSSIDPYYAGLMSNIALGIGVGGSALWRRSQRILPN